MNVWKLFNKKKQQVGIRTKALIADHKHKTSQISLVFMLQQCAEDNRRLLTELQNVIRLSETKPEIDLEKQISNFDDLDYTPLEIAERNVIKLYLEKCNWNQTLTSRQLGIRPNTLIAKLRKFNIEHPNGKARRGRKPNNV